MDTYHGLHFREVAKLSDIGPRGIRLHAENVFRYRF